MALISLQGGLELVVAFALVLLIYAFFIRLESRRPETKTEKHEYVDAWQTFRPAGERRRLEAELRRKEEEMRDVVIVEVSHQPERIVCRRAA